MENALLTIVAQKLSTFQYTFECDLSRGFSNICNVFTALAIALFLIKNCIEKESISLMHMVVKVLKSTLRATYAASFFVSQFGFLPKISLDSLRSALWFQNRLTSTAPTLSRVEIFCCREICSRPKAPPVQTRKNTTLDNGTASIMERDIRAIALATKPRSAIQIALMS
ncbi:MAG: hypothetical protein FWC13_04530 [Oscillospiraceae bacterium]|nr:hypothetical protein [Oscillospiraceae bacterium]